VATSGNLSDEPICTDEREAVSRLSGIADRFLIHDRPIERHVDDSVAWWVDGAPALIRRARGYAPEPLWLRDELPPLLAVGAHLKNTIAVSSDRRVFVSQHVGDLETPEAMAAFERVILDFLEFYGIRPVAIVHDRHPDYGSTHWARNASASGILSGVRLLAVQHHHAHLSACLEENGARGPSLGVVWDGTGYGEDGTVWGGEFLMGDATGFRRVAHLLPFRLAGGEAAIKEPRRVAYALLREAFGGDLRGLETLPPVKVLEEREREVLDRLLDRGLLSPVTTSAGRLFDGIAALTGIRQFAAYEGQAAMELEWAAGDVEGDPYPFSILDEGLGEGLVLDWRPLVREVARNVLDGTNAAKISAGFHAAMANAIAEMASRLGVPRVALAGGCFQNRLLTEGAARKLRDRGLEVLLHRQLPPNDGSICLGQIAVAAAKLKQGD